MKLTTFNPQIITKDAEGVVQLFEALGFERRHTKEEIGELGVTGIRMKDANGFYLDISTKPIGCSLTAASKTSTGIERWKTPLPDPL